MKEVCETAEFGGTITFEVVNYPGMGNNRKVHPHYEVTIKEGRHYCDESVYVSKHRAISQHNLWHTPTIADSRDRMRKNKYVIENGNAKDESICDAKDGPSIEPEDESSLKRRWFNGNILVICLPLGASILPSVFLLGAFLHADQFNLMKLKNNTDVPYISDIGDKKPHSSVFTLGLSFGAMFGFWLILVRHIQVDKIFDDTGSKANRFATFFGLMGILGELTVAAFQLSSHFIMHYLGAFVLFAFIMIYMFIQSYITHRNLLKMGNVKYAKALVIFRVILCVVLLMSLVIFGTFLLPSLSPYNRKGYSVAQSAEWAMLGCVIIFMLTFLYDFKDLTCFVDVGVLKDTKSCNTVPGNEGIYNYGVDE